MADYAAPKEKWQTKTQPRCAANPPYGLARATRTDAPRSSAASYKRTLWPWMPKVVIGHAYDYASLIVRLTANSFFQFGTPLDQLPPYSW